MDPFDDIDLRPLLDASIWPDAHDCFPEENEKKTRPYEDLYEVVPLWLYARTCLEEEDARHEESIVLNDQPVVNRLPRNVLARIFEHLRDITSHPSSPSATNVSHNSGTHSYSWLYVTLVCRHWQNTAYTRPSLWTYIDLAYERDLVRSLLILSENESLYVYSDTSKPAHEVSSVADIGDYAIRLDLVMDEQARIKELELNLSSTKHVKLVPWKQFSSQPAPRMTRLVLRGTLNNIKLEKRILPAFKEQNFPQLRILVLDGLYPRWVGTSLPMLLHLELCNVDGSGGCTPGDFVRFLSQCKELHSLKIDACNLLSWRERV